MSLIQVEQQAFCRVFRIGQHKETHMARLVIKGTVDAAIYALQGDKQRLIGIALSNSQRKERIGIQEIMGLFGRYVTKGCNTKSSPRRYTDLNPSI
jgi:SNF2 family DNA or RNA helicase